MVWDVSEAWGDDPPSHPVIHKSKGMNREPPKPPFSDLADASNDFDVFRNRQNRPNRPNRQRGNGSPIFPRRRSRQNRQNRQNRHSWSMVFRRALKPHRVEGPNKNKGKDPSNIKFI